MNKLIWIPLTTIILLAIVSSVYIDTTTFGGNTTINQPGEITVNGTTTNVTIPGSGVQTFNMSGIQMALVILFSAIILGTVTGIHFLGSGLSDTTQKIIFNSVIYLGLWGIFSILAYDLLSDMSTELGFGILLWMILTIVYIIGFAQTIQGGASD